VLDIMRSGIDSAMMGMGVASLDELRPELFEIREGFSRRAGAGVGRSLSEI